MAPGQTLPPLKVEMTQLARLPHKSGRPTEGENEVGEPVVIPGDLADTSAILHDSPKLIKRARPSVHGFDGTKRHRVPLLPGL